MINLWMLAEIKIERWNTNYGNKLLYVYKE